MIKTGMNFLIPGLQQICFKLVSNPLLNTLLFKTISFFYKIVFVNTIRQERENIDTPIDGTSSANPNLSFVMIQISTNFLYDIILSIITNLI